MGRTSSGTCDGGSKASVVVAYRRKRAIFALADLESCRNVKTNVAVSIALKAVFLVAAITGHATLWMAVLADTGASVIVVANALRLLRAR